MTGSASGREGEDDRVETALRAGLRADALSPEALERIRRATWQEWRSIPRPSARRRWVVIGAAASVACVVLSTVWAVRALDSDAGAGALVGTIVRADAPGVLQVRPLRRDELLPAGSSVREGQSLTFAGDAVVALSGGGSLRIARATSIRVESAKRLRIDAGEVYQDVPLLERSTGGVALVTADGEFQHVGTQFALAAYDGVTRLRVREGRVRWQSGATVQLTDAGTEVVLGAGRAVVRRPIDTAGRDWMWAESLAPTFVIENRRLLDFLTWAARETGRTVIFADTDSRHRATATILHGDIQGMAALEALATVMQTTSLRYELPRGQIRVSSSSASLPINK